MPALTATQQIVTVFAFGLWDDAEDMSTIVVAGDHTAEADADAFFDLCLAQLSAEEREEDGDDDEDGGEFDRASFEQEYRWTMYTTVVLTIA